LVSPQYFLPVIMERECFPISIRLTGVLRKEKIEVRRDEVLTFMKLFEGDFRLLLISHIFLQMYITSVLWSDRNEIVVYRGFDDFRELHKYCNELLRCDQQVLQSADLRMFLQPKEKELQPEFTKNRYPHIQMMPQHNVQNSSSLLAPSSPLHHSCSYGNLSQLPNCRPTSPNLTGAHRSQSLNRLSDGPNAQPAASHYVPAQKHSITPTSAMQGPAPVIMVQSDREKTGRILRGESVDSFESDSDNALSMSASSSLNLSYSANDEQLQLCRTSPPMVASCLSPTNNPKGTLLPSVSDPNLYKGPRSPKVPPRPQPREILTRCTTVTCKNANKSNLSHKLR
ncbi:hypothetical protein XENOCAPTIV_023690, partial [Xenoophorus captivus]